MVLQYYSGKRLIIVISCHSDNRPSQICDKNDKFCSIRLYSKWTDLSCWMVFDSRNRSMLLKNFHLSLFLLFCYFVFILWDSIIVNILKFCMPIFLTKWHMQTVQTQIRLLLQSDLGLFFFYLGFTALTSIFHLYWADRSSKVGENGRTPGNEGLHCLLASGCWYKIQILNGKQCRPRSVGFWRSQLIWIYTVCKDRAYPGSVGERLNFARWVANSADPDQMSCYAASILQHLIWVCTVCSGLFVPILMVIMVCS